MSPRPRKSSRTRLLDACDEEILATKPEEVFAAHLAPPDQARSTL
jgi:hypothetical protein